MSVVIDDGGGGHSSLVTYYATLNFIYKAKYSDVTGVPANTSRSGSTTSYSAKGSISLSGNLSTQIPVREGYTFLGWRKDDDDSKRLYQPGDGIRESVSYGKTYNLYLYTRWSIKTYTIQYNLNGGEGSPFSQTKNYGSDINISSTVPTRENFIFSNWNTASDGTGTSYSSGQTYSANENLTLYAVWRPASSIPTVNNQTADVGTAVVISTNRTDPNAIHTLKYSIEGVSGTIATNVATSHTWTIPSEFYNILSTKVSSVCNITCDTFVDGSQIGITQAVPLTVTIPERIKPTLLVSTSAVNDGDLSTVLGSTLVQGYSKISFSLSSTPGTGATFARYTIVGQDLPSNLDPTASTVVTNILSGSGNLIWSIYATDSRGRSSDVINVQATVAAYSSPSISPISVQRCDQYGNQNQSSGTYLNARSFYSATNVGENEIVSAKVYYRVAGSKSSAWTLGVDLSEEVGGGSGSWTGAFGGGNIAIEESYEVKYEIQDSIGDVMEMPVISNISYPMPSSAGISYGIYNDRLRLGGLVEEPGFVVDWASKFKNSVAIQNLDALGMSFVITGEGDNMSLLLTGNK